MLNGCTNEKTIQKMSDCTLPALPVEFDKDYVIEIAAIQEEAYALFRRSGYTLWHRPNVCLQGYTRKKIIVNPYRKRGTDAVKEGAFAISFSEFLTLFENAETDLPKDTEEKAN